MNKQIHETQIILIHMNVMEDFDIAPMQYKGWNGGREYLSHL